MDTKSKEELTKMGRNLISDKEFNDDLDMYIANELKYTEEANKEEGVNSIDPKLLITVHEGNHEGNREKKTVMVAFAGVDFNDSDTKRKIMFGVGAKMAEEKMKPVAVYLVSEAWVATDDPKKGGIHLKKDAEGNMLPPSQQPLRSEAMIVFGKTIDGRCNLSSVEFKRISGKVLFFEDRKMVQHCDNKFRDGGSTLLDEFYKGFLMNTLNIKNNPKHD